MKGPLTKAERRELARLLREVDHDPAMASALRALDRVLDSLESALHKAGVK